MVTVHPFILAANLTASMAPRLMGWLVKVGLHGGIFWRYLRVLGGGERLQAV